MISRVNHYFIVDKSVHTLLLSIITFNLKLKWIRWCEANGLQPKRKRFHFLPFFLSFFILQTIFIFCSCHERYGRWNLSVRNISFVGFPRRDGSKQSNELPNISASKWYNHSRTYRYNGLWCTESTYAFTIWFTIDGNYSYFLVSTKFPCEIHLQILAYSEMKLIKRLHCMFAATTKSICSQK